MATGRSKDLDEAVAIALGNKGDKLGNEVADPEREATEQEPEQQPTQGPTKAPMPKLVSSTEGAPEKGVRLRAKTTNLALNGDPLLREIRKKLGLGR